MSDEYVYGICPICLDEGVMTPGVSRERRINGNDECAKGHIYPSADAIYPKKESKEPE